MMMRAGFVQSANLYRRYRRAYIQLAVWGSEGAAGTIAPSSSAGKPGAIILADPNELSEHTVRIYERRWAKARTDEHRHAVVSDMEQDVAKVRYPDPIERPSETEDERRDRILKDTEGFEPEMVGRSGLGVTSRDIVKWRRLAGLDTQTGRPLSRLSSAQRLERVRQLVAQGVESPGELARRLGEPNKWGILRDLRKLKDEAA